MILPSLQHPLLCPRCHLVSIIALGFWSETHLGSKSGLPLTSCIIPNTHNLNSSEEKRLGKCNQWRTQWVNRLGDSLQRVTEKHIKPEIGHNALHSCRWSVRTKKALAKQFQGVSWKQSGSPGRAVPNGILRSWNPKRTSGGYFCFFTSM